MGEKVKDFVIIHIRCYMLDGKRLSYMVYDWKVTDSM